MTVVITGATKGIGRALAEKFAAAGYSIVACARSETDLKNMAEDFFSRFPRISFDFMAIDIGNKEQVKSFGSWIANSGFSPGILVNNAGYFLPGDIHSEDDGMIERMVAVNLYGAYHLTRQVLPGMISRKKGHIFNICSIASFKPMANVGSYGISKFALLGFSKHLREEMKPFNIKVTAVYPGATMTASWEGTEVSKERIMEADDIAEMVLAASRLSEQAVVEDIIIRPQLGDL